MHAKAVLQSRFLRINAFILVRGGRDSRSTLVPIYGDLYQTVLEGKTNENRLVTNLDFTSERNDDVIKMAHISYLLRICVFNCILSGSGSLATSL